MTVQLTGGVNAMMPVSYMTHASVPAPVPFPQLSPHVPSYRPITPSPCALGQQVIVVLLFPPPRVLLPRIIVSTYTIFLGLVIVLRLSSRYRPYLGPFPFCLHTLALGSLNSVRVSSVTT